ncbi:phosphate signaling complex protein PhoU [Candidatus Nitrosacidococcus sp. I8]|uniref:phosphate signaling complex protein PhoU n=1 Tax=Candidatus Nitrosacidococcus sp. I8 TaxID=2942908 RepID=UPI002227DCBA|nr:phosphate signaling complex protein PhoU [Candidatus Nitrosacidococcus sp. I8]CAH9017113.1 Phosphate-specific transport system accessory protein PhoU [Candidatus Nitrosacidococcus sp. I8]
MPYITSPHTSRQYDRELEGIRTRVLLMGQFVAQQVSESVESLVKGDAEQARKVISNEYQVDAMDISIDEECTQILACRQPAASDLRLVIAVIKIIADLERIGDGAERVSRAAIRSSKWDTPSNIYESIKSLANYTLAMLYDSLEAFKKMDMEMALEVATKDPQVDAQYEGILRQLITYMIEDPRNISWAVELLWVGRALERIGDHVRNICEYVIYLVKGKDVRHAGLEDIEQIVYDK